MARTTVDLLADKLSACVTLKSCRVFSRDSILYILNRLLYNGKKQWVKNMDVTLINNYLERHRGKNIKKLITLLQYILDCSEGGKIALVFGFPGVAVEGSPICNCRMKKGNVTILFFRKDIFDQYSQFLEEFLPGICSLTVGNPKDFMEKEEGYKLIAATASAVKIDADFTKQAERENAAVYGVPLL